MKKKKDTIMSRHFEGQTSFLILRLHQSR